MIVKTNWQINNDTEAFKLETGFLSFFFSLAVKYKIKLYNFFYFVFCNNFMIY